MSQEVTIIAKCVVKGCKYQKKYTKQEAENLKGAPHCQIHFLAPLIVKSVKIKNKSITTKL
jgi:hypothetical protein